MKTCVSSYSFGGYIEKLGIKGLIDKAAEMGFEGFEFVYGGWTNNFDLDLAKELNEYTLSKGLVPVSACTGANFLGDLDAEVARLKKEVDFAAALGVKNMRHDTAYGFGGVRKYSVGFDDALPFIVKGTLEVTKYAEQKGVGTMTENHGYFAQDCARVEKIVNGVAHPNFGALVDIGNFMCADEDPVKSVGVMAPYCKHVHAKDFHWKSGMEVDPGAGWFRTRAGNYIRGAIVGHGDAKSAQSLGVLKRAGYDGFVSIEFEGMEDNLKGIQVGLDNIKRFIA
ncbi:MAG: sugar phosphate isomerase/epimerase [Clostridiales bacterium]|nr:sugar phosphate isomerase/epimerase [Clostridiales bacterium]